MTGEVIHCSRGEGSVLLGCYGMMTDKTVIFSSVVSEVHLRMLSGWVVANRHVILRMRIYRIRSRGHVLGGGL